MNLAGNAWVVGKLLESVAVVKFALVKVAFSGAVVSSLLTDSDYMAYDREETLKAVAGCELFLDD